MKSTCINNPPRERLIIIKEWQVVFCNGNTCAAALLSFFEYWHNIRIDQIEKNKQYNNVSERNGEGRTQDESLYQFHNEVELEDGIMIYKRDTISKAIKLLENKGAITVTTNPNDKYNFDRTRFFLFHPDVINDWLTNYYEKFKAVMKEEKKKKRDQRKKKIKECKDNKRKEDREVMKMGLVVKEQEDKKAA